MKNIKVVTWTETVQGKEATADTTTLLDMMIKMMKPEDAPRGLDNFRIMNRLDKAFTKAKTSGTLILEEQDYSFLKERIEKDVPAAWGAIPKAAEAVELFMEAESEVKE